MRLSAVADALPEVTECTLGVTAVADGAVVTTAQVFDRARRPRAPTPDPRRLRGL